MSRALRPDDIAIVVVDDVEYPLIITFVSHDHIIANNYILIPTVNGWQVYNYDFPHHVKFAVTYREQLLSGIEDVDRLILLDLDYRSLLAACTSDSYTNNICRDDYFWRQKVEHDMGHEVVINKLPEMSYREQYHTLINGMDIDDAIEDGRLDYLIFMKVNFDRYTAQMAALYGWINILSYALNHGAPFDSEISRNAAYGGNIAVLEWLYDMNNISLDSETANSAAEGQAIEALEWLYEKGIYPDDDGFIYAVDEGSIDVMKWLLDHNITLIDPKEITYLIIETDNIAMLELLETYGILSDEEGANIAVRLKNRRIIEWLAERGIYPA
jgi:hypothetical protein